MKSFDLWRIQNEVKILRSEKKRTGNELPPEQVEAGGMYKSGPRHFKGQLEGFKSKLSHKESQPDGLGDKGMEGVGKSTFDREPVRAGETPTISHGMPVGELKGQFEALAPSVRMGQQDPTGQPPVPNMNGQGLPPSVLKFLDLAMKAAAHLGTQKLRELWQIVNQKMETLIAQSNTSAAAANTLRKRQALLTKKGGF